MNVEIDELARLIYAIAGNCDKRERHAICDAASLIIQLNSTDPDPEVVNKLRKSLEDKPYYGR